MSVSQPFSHLRMGTGTVSEMQGSPLSNRQ